MSTFKLIIKPGHVIKKREFLQNAPPFSIALDGFVEGAPWLDRAGPKANFNHHEDVDRLATRATCGQVAMFIRSGLFTNTFQKDGVPKATVFINDIDHDACLSTWLIKNHDQLVHTKNSVRYRRRLNAIIDFVDKMDTFSGTYPFNPRSGVLRKMAWIFGPYSDARQSGELKKASAKRMAEILTEVHDRIDRYCRRNGGTRKLDTRYRVMAETKHVTMVKEIGADARMKMAFNGIKSFIAYRGKNQHGGHEYSIGVIGLPTVSFKKLFYKLNQIELDENKGWGGGNTIGGSNRAVGSSLSPSVLFEKVNDYLEREEMILQRRREAKDKKRTTPNMRATILLPASPNLPSVRCLKSSAVKKV